MKNKSIRWQSRTPKYPDFAFLTAVWIQKPEHQFRMLMPLSNFFSSMSDIPSYIEETRGFVASRYDNTEIDDIAFITEVALDACIPLKKEFWENQTLIINYEKQAQEFTQFFRMYEMYRILVTPIGIHKGGEEFSVIAPLSASSLNEKIAGFMFYSNYPVDRMATYAAIYKPIKVRAYNWKQGSLGDVSIIIDDRLKN
jgi:hypothetical protein